MMPTMMMMMISYDKSAKPSCITFASNNHYVPRASVRCNDRPGEIAMRWCPTRRPHLPHHLHPLPISHPSWRHIFKGTSSTVFCSRRRAVVMRVTCNYSYSNITDADANAVRCWQNSNWRVSRAGLRLTLTLVLLGTECTYISNKNWLQHFSWELELSSHARTTPIILRLSLSQTFRGKTKHLRVGWNLGKES